MRLAIQWTIALFTCSVAGIASAQTGISAGNCEACTKLQIAQRVRSCDAGIDYIADFRSNVIYKACAYIDVNDGVRPATRTRELQIYPVESAVQQNFNLYENVYTNNNLTLGYTAYLKTSNLFANLQQSDKIESFASAVFDVLIPSANAGDVNGNMNAYDTVVSPAANERLINYLASKAFSAPSLAQANPGMGPGLVGAIATLENAFTSKIISFSNFNATYVVQFPDGSMRTYRMDFVAHTYAPVPGTARDAHGNIVPENRSMVSNGNGVATYNFQGAPGSDLNNFINLATSFGATFGSGTGASMTCTWDGTTLKCALPR